MENQEKTSCCMGMKKHGKWIIVKVIILFIGIAIGVAIGGHCRGGRGFEMKGNMMAEGRGMMTEGRGMTRGDFDKKDLKKLSTGDQQKMLQQQTVIKYWMTKIAALQDNYSSMMKFIQRGDVTNAGGRIDLVITELTQLKADLPTMVTSFNK